MLKALVIMSCLFLSLNSWSVSGREVWHKATRNQKLFILEEYRIYFAQNPEALGEWKAKKTTYLRLIQHAYAAEMNCIFAGWPSLKVDDKCAPPSSHNPAYQNGSCEENQLQCQPLFFGEGHCVPVGTKKDRSLSFGRCQKSFAEAGKSYEDVLVGIEAANKETELLSLLDFADENCKTGFQSPQYLCRRLETVLLGFKEAQDKADGVTETVTPAGAPVEQVAKEVTLINETVQAAVVVPTNCDPQVTAANETVSTGGIYSPAQALADLNSGALTFLGRDLMPGSDQNRTCVFKSDRAFVLYNNCMSNRREAPATDIEIISFSGESIRFYVENGVTDAPISILDRAQYDGTWSVQYKQGAPIPATASLAQLKTYKEALNTDYSGACWIGETGGARGRAQGKCHGNKLEVQSAWAQASEGFWSQPGPAWTAAKRMLREKARTTPF